MRINRGILFGIGAYTMWGLLPLYWKSLQQVPALEILADRMVWSFVFVVALSAITRHWSWIRPALRSRRVLVTYLVTASLLAINWFTYIWAVNAGFIIETSLGYFINPLLNVLLGILFLHERLRVGQVFALCMAALGVTYLTIVYGSFPWIAIILALTFGFYGLLRKTGSLESMEGLTIETAVYFIPAMVFLLFLNANGNGSFANGDLRTTLLLAGTGLVTGIPLLLFGAAAKRITMTNLGLLQYIAPTLQFLLGLFVYQEEFSQDRLIGFALIWSALIIYSIEGLRHNRGKTNPQTLAKTSASD